MKFLGILLVIGVISFLLENWLLLFMSGCIFIVAAFTLVHGAISDSEFFPNPDFNGYDPKYENQMYDEIRQDINRARRNLDKNGVKY